MEKILQRIHLAVVKLQESRIEQAANQMILQPGNPNHGGIPWHGLGKPHIAWHDTGSVNFIPRALSLWNDAASRFFHEDDLLQKIDFALDFLLRHLPPSGLLSMNYCNFSSPADTGFAMYAYGPILETMRRSQNQSFKEKILPKLEKLTQKMGEALIGGGIHTPNHRWSNVQGLGWTWRLFGIEEAKQYAEKWLNEGIDITSDGEFMERSSNYSNHSDRSLLSAAFALNSPQLIEPARKNLQLLPYLAHADNTVVTDFSRRNDAGLDVHLARFLESAYLLNALVPDDFSAMLLKKCSEQLLRTGTDDETYLTPSTGDLLPWMQIFPAEEQKFETPANWTDSYTRAFGDKSIKPTRDKALNKIILPYSKSLGEFLSHPTHGAPFLRIRKGEFSATIMTFSDSLLSLRMGDAKILGLYLTFSYFGQGAAFASELVKNENHWRLQRPQMRAAYFSPLNRPISPLDMEYSQRKLVNENRLHWSLDISELKDGLRLRFRSSGAREESGHEMEVPAQIVIQFPLSGNLHGKNLFSATKLPPIHLPGYISAPDENDFYLFQESAIYSTKNNSIIISGGASQHNLPLVLGDQIPRANRRNMRINLLFPGEHILEIRCN